MVRFRAMPHADVAASIIGQPTISADLVQFTDLRAGAVMLMKPEYDGQISYDFEEFCADYGHPAGQLFTFEVTHNAVTYVYADVPGMIRGDEVIFSLDQSDLVDTRKAH